MRDWFIPPIIYGLLYYFRPFPNWWTLLPCIALTGAALTAYWGRLTGKDNFYLHGFMCGLGAFPLIWSGFSWVTILIRAIILALIMGGLNWWVNKKQIKYSDWIEELGRGAILTLTLPIL